MYEIFVTTDFSGLLVKKLALKMFSGLKSEPPTFKHPFPTLITRFLCT